MSKFSGITSKTAENLVLGAGAYFKNYDIETDTYETAVLGNKLIGATSGGGSFVATAQYTVHEVDGAPANTAGLTFLDSWTVSMSAKVVEVTEETIKAGLGAASVTASAEHSIITGKAVLEDTDYLENVTFVGRLAKTNTPIIIQVFNALHVDGLTMNFEDKGKATIEFAFNGYYKITDVETAPFKILYPKAVTQ